jgi:hypothetical protein
MVNGRAWCRSALHRCLSATLAGAFWLATHAAGALELALPLACAPGADCWVVRLVDHDPGPGFTDHRCGVLGSDGHDGTDFAIEDARRMAEGVAVLASAPGTVAGVRDGMPDQPPEGRLVHDFADRNCGNGVLLRHADGWETQYCHLRQGSVQVARGDTVAAGQPLGLVGMSGEANFPHVHLSVRHDGVGIDPFTGGRADEACATIAASSWEPPLRFPLAYDEIPIAVVGLTDRLPDRDAIVAGRVAADSLSSASPALVGYALAYGLRTGDRLEIHITGPDGQPVSSAGFDLDQDAPRATRAAGRRRPAEGWPPGPYRVEAQVVRGDRSFTRATSFTVAQ